MKCCDDLGSHGSKKGKGFLRKGPCLKAMMISCCWKVHDCRNMPHFGDFIFIELSKGNDG